MNKQTEVETFQQEASELLATEILRTNTDAFKGLGNFKDFLISNDASMSDKQNQIFRLQMTLFGQMLTPLISDEIDPVLDRKAKMAKSLYTILNDMSNSIYTKADYEDKENVDFEHPKVQKAFDFLIEGVIESMQEADIELETINSFLSLLAVKMTGFESELNSRMKGLRGAALDKVQNPLLKAFKIARRAREKAIDVVVLDTYEDDGTSE